MAVLNCCVNRITNNGDDVKLYTNLNFNVLKFASQTIDATQMTHFHMDIWTPNSTTPPAAFKVLLVDFGANGVFGGEMMYLTSHLHS